MRDKINTVKYIYKILYILLTIMLLRFASSFSFKISFGEKISQENNRNNITEEIEGVVFGKEEPIYIKSLNGKIDLNSQKFNKIRMISKKSSIKADSLSIDNENDKIVFSGNIYFNLKNELYEKNN